MGEAGFDEVWKVCVQTFSFPLSISCCDSFVTLKVAEVAFAIIKATLEKGVKNGVLIHCWGGINRSGATAVAFLATQCLGIIQLAFRDVSGPNDKILHHLM